MPAHRIAEPDFRERVEESFDRQAAMKLIGAELTRCEPGIVEIEMPFREELTQQHGILHGVSFLQRWIQHVDMRPSALCLLRPRCLR